MRSQVLRPKPNCKLAFRTDALLLRTNQTKDRPQENNNILQLITFPFTLIVRIVCGLRSVLMVMDHILLDRVSLR